MKFIDWFCQYLQIGVYKNNDGMNLSISNIWCKRGVMQCACMAHTWAHKHSYTRMIRVCATHVICAFIYVCA